MPKRITYQNWIVRMGHDPADQTVDIPPPAEKLFETLFKSQLNRKQSKSQAAGSRTARTIEAVREGLNTLDEEEREFIHLFYFLGRSYRQISTSSGRAIHRLEALHSRAIRRLKRSLADFVKGEFGIEFKKESECPLCSSELSEKINQLLDSKREQETWSRTIATLKRRFGIRVATPQLLIGHQKFHRTKKER